MADKQTPVSVANSSLKNSGFITELIEMPDGHDYLVVHRFSSYAGNSSVSMIHAAGCRECINIKAAMIGRALSNMENEMNKEMKKLDGEFPG